MKKNTKKILSGATGAAMLLSGVATVASAEVGFEVKADETVKEYNKVANVQGGFSFDQETVTPADEVFNLFGTVVTGMCAKPDFAVGEEKTEYFVNVGGKIEKSYTVDLKEKTEESRVQLCACATGAATANAQITGVLLKDVLELAKTTEEVNTVAVTGADGYTTKLPLTYVLEKEAMIAYQVGGKDIPTGAQFWVPETVAKYFTRNVVDIELLKEENVPEVEARDEALQAEVVINNAVEGASFAAGQAITFEGYADDLGEPIAKVEFSLDGGETWTAYETTGASADKWVYWHFSTEIEEAGEYQLTARAVTESGKVSPLAANVAFEVVDGAAMA